MEIGPHILALGAVGYLIYSRSPKNNFYLFDRAFKKSALPNIDIAKLSKEFPDRVQIADEAIKVTAPFRISSNPQGPVINFMKYSDSLFRRDVQIATGVIIGAAIFAALDRQAHPTPGTTKGLRIPVGQFAINPLSTLSRTVMAVSSGLFAAFVAGKIFDRIMR